jgi:riboflavin biosynthesis pyrimidine reductase
MNKPEVIVVQEASVDGKLAVSSDRPLLYGDERWNRLRGTKSFDLFKWLMNNRGVQATLEGSNSFVREGDIPNELSPYKEKPTSLYDDFLPQEIIEREDHRGWFIAVDSCGRIRWVYKDGYPGDDTWTGWHAMVLVSKSTPPSYLFYLQQEFIPYLVCGDVKVDLGSALEKLSTKLDVKTLLSTAGGVLNGILLKNGLVDEINIEFLPGIIGGDESPSLFKGYSISENGNPTKLKFLSSTTQSGGQVWLRYKVINNQLGQYRK